MKKIWILATILALMGLSRPSSAQEPLLGALSEQYFSVLRVMEREGCNYKQLPQALKESGIKPENVRRLPVGQKVYLAGGCKKNVPAQAVTAPSSKKAEAENTAQVNAVRDSLSNIRKELASATAANTALSAALKDSVQRFNKQLEEERAKKVSAGSPASSRVQWLNILGGGLLGVILAVAAVVWFQRNTAKFPLSVTVVDHEDDEKKKHEFQWLGATKSPSGNGKFINKWQCPNCGEPVSGSKRNCLGHLGDCTKLISDRAIFDLA